MAQGKVTVNNLNLAQGDAPEIERKALFIGECTIQQGNFISINSQSDLDELLGEETSELKKQVVAAQVNGGENWQAHIAPQAAGYVWEDVVNEAMNFLSPEFIVLCRPASTALEINDMQVVAESLRTRHARRVIILTAVRNIDFAPDGGESWGEYEANIAAITRDVVAGRVACVPLLHDNNVGVLAGRLCNRSVSISDSPMRVASGALLGLGLSLLDRDGIPLSNATLAALDANRFSVPQRYPDYAGIYWGDCNLLDVPGGDYTVIENLRPVDKAARAVRLVAISKIADRSLNSTTISIAANQNHLSKPLRQMSVSTFFAGLSFPGDIKPPQDDAVTIVWPTRTQVNIYLKVQPYNAPKAIEVNIVLDLSSA